MSPDKFLKSLIIADSYPEMDVFKKGRILNHKQTPITIDPQKKKILKYNKRKESFEGKKTWSNFENQF